MKKYTYNLDEIPQKEKPVFERLNNLMEMAWAHQGKSVKIRAGYYFVRFGNTLYEVEKIEEGTYKGWWLSREPGNEDSLSEPVETKKQLIEGIEGTAGIDEYRQRPTVSRKTILDGLTVHHCFSGRTLYSYTPHDPAYIISRSYTGYDLSEIESKMKLAGFDVTV